MKERIVAFVLMGFITLIIFFSACQEQPTELSNETATEAEEATLKKINQSEETPLPTDGSKLKKGDDSVATRDMQCGETFRYQWELDHYENIPGKIVGIWPTHNRWANIDSLTLLKEKWGFGYIGVYIESNFVGYYSNAINAGYTNDRIMGILNYFEAFDWQGAIQSKPPLWGYYFDEIVQKLYFQNPLRDDYDLHFNYIRSVIEAKSLSAQFVSGETDDSYGAQSDQIVDVMMCTRYDNNPWGDDQRSIWTDFRNTCGAKFSQSWMAADLDYGEFIDLFGHANNLGLNGIWLYQHGDVGPDDTQMIKHFCNSAWYAGWLKKYEKEVKVYYECGKPDPCDCDPEIITDGWEVLRKVYTGSRREVNP